MNMEITEIITGILKLTEKNFQLIDELRSTVKYFDKLMSPYPGKCTRRRNTGKIQVPQKR
jgi:hypothetical protein